MKNLLTFTILCLFCFQSQNTQAQFWKKLKEKVIEKVEEQVIDKTVKETEKEVDDILNKKKKDKKASEKKKTKKQPTSQKPDSEAEDNEESTKKEKMTAKKDPAKLYRNYKYIPGEKVIFYDDLQYEEVGEFPSRWDLLDGGAEIATLNGEKVIISTAVHDNEITPLFKDKNYLGDEFTLEFDAFIPNDYYIIEIDFLTGSNYIHFSFEEGSFGGSVYDATKKGNTFFSLEVIDGKKDDWNHIAISFHKGKLKVYINEKRVGNLPNFGADTSKGISMDLQGNRKPKLAIKNIRIAHGGGQMYKRIMADGKYVTNGILFDSGKATIKPQSMGVINKIVSVMKEKADWNFEIIGHTDSDGDDTTNLTLSKQRAESVKQAIVALGITANRLSTTGKGETEPLNTNSTKEEKANNRRVEFIKK